MTSQSDSNERRGGLLLAMMEPPATLEAEFQDWYDNEHFPERAGCEGFLTANRFVCLDGFPRYLALYDLADNNVLNGPGYAAIARNRYSLWTKRIIPQVWGHYRAEGNQLYPGNALLGSKGAASRVMLWRFRQAPESAGQHILNGLRESFEKLPTFLQFRLFQAQQPDGIDFLAITEFSAPTEASPAVAHFGDALRHLDLTNTYTRYWR